MFSDGLILDDIGLFENPGDFLGENDENACESLTCRYFVKGGWLKSTKVFVV